MRKVWLTLFIVSLIIVATGCYQQGSSPITTVSSESPPLNATSTSTSHSSGSSTDTQKPVSKLQMNDITAVRIINPSSGWIGGKGWIARTDNSGKDWTTQYQGGQTVQQLFALNGNEAWVVFNKVSGNLNSSRLLHTNDGGKHWVPVGSMPNSSFLHFTSNQMAFAGNAYSTDGGKTWSRIEVPAIAVEDAYFHDRKHGWVVTQKQGTFDIKRTIDDGKTWRTVMTRKTITYLNGSVIRSAGINDAWVECIGDSGMSQTSYSLFHTMDGGKHWLTVIANSTAGAGPAPGFPMNYHGSPRNEGSKPGQLYVVNPKVAYMSGYCPACDNSNFVGWTWDGGKTWNNGKQSFPGFQGALLAIADKKHGWWITRSVTNPAVMYTTKDGGSHWNKIHTFDSPKKP